MFRVMTASGDVTKALQKVLDRVKSASAGRAPEVARHSAEPRLVAVSKTKPKEMVIEAYIAGQRHFGENYVQELVDKASDPEVLARCPDICWHMIGPIQSNKAKKVVNVPGLKCIETVHTSKLATQLNEAWEKQRSTHELLDVFVQVNTSSEEQKSGVAPDMAANLVGHIISSCPALRFKGLMTIGIFDYDLANGPNPDFQVLLRCREEVCRRHNLSLIDVELSMGMSTDFEHAISVGSTNVRVGSTIFGARNYSS